MGSSKSRFAKFNVLGLIVTGWLLAAPTAGAVSITEDFTEPNGLYTVNLSAGEELWGFFVVNNDSTATGFTGGIQGFETPSDIWQTAIITRAEWEAGAGAVAAGRVLQGPWGGSPDPGIEGLGFDTTSIDWDSTFGSGAVQVNGYWVEVLVDNGPLFGGEFGDTPAANFTFLASLAASDFLACMAQDCSPSAIGSTVPEPTTASLLALGMVGLAALRRRKNV